MELTNRSNKHRQVWNLFVIACALAMLSIAPIAMITQASNEALGDSVPILVRTANLAAPSGSVNPHGFAEYELYADGNRELEIEVEDTAFAEGTVLDMFVNGTNVGQAATDINGKARLKLKTEDGQAVPETEDGDTVEVRNEGTIVVNGVLGGGGPNPSPSPTTSPTGSPSPSPTDSPSPSPSPTGTPDDENEISASLNGPTINGVLPRGYAEYEDEGNGEREFELYVDRVSMPAGTQLNVSVDGNPVGQFNLENDNKGELELETEDGDTVPLVSPGSIVEVFADTTLILSGEFDGGGSPTPSPTPGEQGRHFEGHLDGDGLEPAVPGEGRGEFEIFLNSDETEAMVIGEFDDLSSAQISAKITVTIGAVTSLIHDLGVLGGTEGHFASQTFAVTPEQVQQLRTGLWFGIVGSENNPDGEIGGEIVSDSDSADFDGDGSNDLAVFRPSTGIWYTLNSEGFSASSLGSEADRPVSADYDGDGRTDKAIFRNVNGMANWIIRHSSDGGTTELQFGRASDKPVRGDFDGDGLNDLAVFRPETGVWYVKKSNNSGYIIVQFGSFEDIPAAGDFDGDGKADIAVFRPSTGVWYVINSSNGSMAINKWGSPGDIPVSGDFDGDGRNDLAVYRPSEGVWYVYRSSDGNFVIAPFGTSEDIPVAGRYDADLRTDIAVFRPSTGQWYILNSLDQTFSVQQFGLSGDIPTISQ